MILTVIRILNVSLISLVQFRSWPSVGPLLWRCGPEVCVLRCSVLWVKLLTHSEFPLGGHEVTVRSDGLSGWVFLFLNFLIRQNSLPVFRRDVSLQSDAALALSARLVTNSRETRVKRIRVRNPRSRSPIHHRSVTYRSLIDQWSAPVVEEILRPVTSVKVPEQHDKNTPAGECSKNYVKVWKYNLPVIFKVFKVKVPCAGKCPPWL